MTTATPEKTEKTEKRVHRSVAEKYQEQEATSQASGPVSTKQRKVYAAHSKKMFGERMYRARTEINGWTQQHAAKLLGYRNSSPLAKIEMGGPYPEYMPAQASKIYGVTTDFLLGVSDFDYECRRPGTEWEKDIVNASKAHLEIMFQEHAKYLAGFARTTGVTVDGLARIIEKASNLDDVFKRMVSLNPELWQEFRGGTRLEVAFEEFQCAAIDVRRAAQHAKIQLRIGSHVAGISEILNDKLDFEGRTGP